MSDKKRWIVYFRMEAGGQWIHSGRYTEAEAEAASARHIAEGAVSTRFMPVLDVDWKA